MIKEIVRRYEQWKGNVAVASPFVIICGIVALLYFAYRIVLIVVPTVSLEQSIFNAQTGDAVCHEQDDDHPKDPAPLLSASYQNRLQKQTGLTKNLVANPDLLDTDQNTGGLAGYTHTVEDSDIAYRYLKQSSDGTLFLRTTTQKKRSAGQVSPAWQMNPVSVAPLKTYAYSFWYRGTTDVHVSLEHMLSSGEIKYSDVMTLDKTTEWRQFTAHFTNNDQAVNFRVDVNGTDAGQVDVRGFDIHQIPDAELAKGIVTITFDDGWQSIYDHALPLLNKYGIKTTQYIISEVAGSKTPGYMDFGTVRELKSQGHEVGSHSLNHCNQTELPGTSIANNATLSRQQLEDQTLGPITSFAYPLGQYNKVTQEIFSRQYSLIRSSDFGYNDRYYDETNVHSMGVVSTTTDKEFKEWLDYAKSHRMWVVLVYHRVDETGPYNVTSSQLEQQFRMIKASGLTVLPLSSAASQARK